MRSDGTSYRKEALLTNELSRGKDAAKCDRYKSIKTDDTKADDFNSNRLRCRGQSLTRNSGNTGLFPSDY